MSELKERIAVAYRLVGAIAAAAAFMGLAAMGARAQTQMQFPTTPWGGFAPAVVQCGWLYGANFNSTADQPIPISVPSANYYISEITVSNPSISLTTAQGGFYSAAAKGGTAIVANTQAYSGLTTNAANTAGNYLQPTQASTSTMWNLATIYLSLTTAQGAAATADVRIFCRPLY